MRPADFCREQCPIYQQAGDDEVLGCARLAADSLTRTATIFQMTGEKRISAREHIANFLPLFSSYKDVSKRWQAASRLLVRLSYDYQSKAADCANEMRQPHDPQFTSEIAADHFGGEAAVLADIDRVVSPDKVAEEVRSDQARRHNLGLMALED